MSSLVAQMVKRLSAVLETGVRSLGWEDPLEKEMATHSSTLAWKIPWTDEPGRLQSMGLQRVGHDWATLLTIMRSRPLGFFQAPGTGTFGISEVKRRMKMQTVSFVNHNRLLSITSEFMLVTFRKSLRMGADWLGNQLGLEVWICSPTLGRERD